VIDALEIGWRHSHVRKIIICELNAVGRFYTLFLSAERIKLKVFNLRWSISDVFELILNPSV